MNRTPPSPEQNLQRLALRARRWLARLLIVLPVFERLAPASARTWVGERLNILARFALDFIFFRAADAYRPQLKVRNPRQAALALKRHDVRVNVRYSVRAAFGGCLRQSLKARGFKARAKAILRALRDRDMLAARLLRRMRRGLSRRMSAHSRVPACVSAFILMLAACVRGPECGGVAPRADTS